MPAATVRDDRRTARASAADSARTAVRARSVAPHCSSSRSPWVTSSTRVPSEARLATTCDSTRDAPCRASANATAPAAATPSTTKPAARLTGPGEGSGPDAHERSRHDRLAYAEPVVEQCVDIVDDPGEQVAPAGAEPSGDERDELGEDLSATLRELAEHHVVAQDALGVAEHRPGQAEEPDPDDRDHQVEHRGLLAGPGDQPPGGRGERDP